MNEKKKLSAQQSAKVIVCSLLLICFFAGIIIMLAGDFGLGVYLWGFSTLGGIIVLGWIRMLDKKAEEAERLARIARGEDEPCE